MRVLLTNDDGILSPGLVALARSIATRAETWVVAPDRQRSATGHAITLHKPLRAERAALPGVDARAWATTGTPADCVALGVLTLLPERPDVVIAGINVGPNMALDLTYSGTVSGAMEAAIIGIPAFAISVAEFEDVRYDVAADFAAHLAEAVVAHGLPTDVVLNVNVPNLPREAVAGVAITRQGTRRYVSRIEPRRDPRGKVYYWLAGAPADDDEPEGTDSWAVARAMISVTPIRLEMTHVALLEEMQRWDLRVPPASETGRRS